MTPGVRTEPELHVRVVQRLERLFVLEDEYFEGECIGTRQLQRDGAWTGWAAPCEVVDETLPAQVGLCTPPGFTPRQWVSYPTMTTTTPTFYGGGIISGNTTTTTGTLTTGIFKNAMNTIAQSAAPSSSNMVVSPKMLEAIQE